MATIFNWINIVILSSLMIKRGVAPFHYWFPNVIEGLSWTNGLILITWQKVAPILLISYTIIDEFLFFCIIISAVIGALGGLNQTSLRKLIAFSSINHLRWILTAIILNERIWIIYFRIYVLINISLILLFNLFKTFHINQLFSIFISSKTLKILFFLNILSLGGLPPFLGFASKWLVIHHIIVNSQLFIVLLLVIRRLITLFFYLRLCYSSFLLNYHEQNWLININFNKNKIFVILIFTSISIFGLIIISLLYFIL